MYMYNVKKVAEQFYPQFIVSRDPSLLGEVVTFGAQT